MTSSRTLFAALLLCTAAAPIAAQQAAPGPLRVGYVVAVAGDSAIFNFTIDEALITRATERRLQSLPEGAELEEWRKEVLDERINELLLLQAALRDTTIKVPEEQLGKAVQQDIDQRQQQAGGAAAFERALAASGLTPSTYREMLLQQQRRQALIQHYLERARRGRKAPPVTEQEIREYFAEASGQFQQRPPSVSFQQVVVRTQPTDAALNAAGVRADSVLRLALAKEDFAELAKRFSQDPGSRDNGGDLGWFRRGTYVQALEDIAFRLEPGQIGPIVRTQFGLHVIKAERVRGSEIQARHILIRPELTADDAARARARADTVAERLRAGADPNELARQYGDRDEPVRVPPNEVTVVQQQYGIDVSQANAGDIIGPVPTGGDDVAEKFVVMKILTREDARPWSVEDREIRERIRENLQFQKLFAEIIDELRRSSYVDVRTS